MTPLKNPLVFFCRHVRRYLPGGALTPKQGLNQGRPREVDKVLTTCPTVVVVVPSTCMCAMIKIVGITPNFAGPMKGHLCVKGRFGGTLLTADRLQNTLIKRR